VEVNCRQAGSTSLLLIKHNRLFLLFKVSEDKVDLEITNLSSLVLPQISLRRHYYHLLPKSSQHIRLNQAFSILQPYAVFKALLFQVSVVTVLTLFRGQNLLSTFTH